MVLLTTFEKFHQIISIITSRKRSCGKEMFSQVSVCPREGVYPSMHLGRGVFPSMHLGRGLCGWGIVYGQGCGGMCVGGGHVHLPLTGTEAAGTDPTGMHSC